MMIEKKNKNNENLLIKKKTLRKSQKKIDSENRIKISPLAKRIAFKTT